LQKQWAPLVFPQRVAARRGDTGAAGV